MTPTPLSSRDNAPQRLIFIGTTRLHYGTDGKLRSNNPVMSLEEWAPFLELFQRIVIIARIETSFISNDGYPLAHPRISIVELPYYDGPLDFYLKRHRLSRFLSKHIKDRNAVFLTWIPSPIGMLVAQKVKEAEASLIVRVVGDAGGVIRAITPRPFNVIAARRASYTAQKTVALADGVIYVTLRMLQELYPASMGAQTLARTNMKFPAELSAIKRKRKNTCNSSTWRLIAVGSQQQNYKGHDLLIEAVSQLQSEGFDLSLTLVGTGRFHQKLIDLAKERDVKNIEFVERLETSLHVAQFVSKFDLFVMPSRTEGMPKALMEAMAVGVLAIGSTAGGIPELLGNDSIFATNSVSSLRECIRVIICNPAIADKEREKQAQMIDRVRTYYSGSRVMSKFLQQFLNHINRNQLPDLPGR